MAAPERPRSPAIFSIRRTRTDRPDPPRRIARHAVIDVGVALLIDLGRGDREAFVLAADVHPVGPRGGEPDSLTLPEDRLDHGHVVEVGASDVGIVQENHIAFLKIVPTVHLRCHLDAQRQIAGEQRHAQRLAEHLAVLIQQRDRAVLALVDQRAVVK